jgi:hypothetical protein
MTRGRTALRSALDTDRENCRSLGYPGRPIRGFESEQRVRFSVKKIACSPVAATNLYGPSGYARDDKVEGTRSPQQWLPRDGQSRRLGLGYHSHFREGCVSAITLFGNVASLQIRCEESMKEVLAGFPADRQAPRSVGSGMKAPLY